MGMLYEYDEPQEEVRPEMSETKLKRSEEAYLEWGTARDAKGIMTIPNDLDGFLSGFDYGAQAARESAAATVEAAGCICLYSRSTTIDGNGVTFLYPNDHLEAEFKYPASLKEDPSVIKHDPHCPIALAEKIREGA